MRWLYFMNFMYCMVDYERDGVFIMRIADPYCLQFTATVPRGVSLRLCM